jgi:hypothetical protein
MQDGGSILDELRADSAKRRERAVKSLTPAALQDAQVVEQLQMLVSADPVQYVRDAAQAQLLAAGQIPRASVVPVQLREEGAAKPAAFALGCTLIPVVLVCAALILVLVLALALLGPGIGDVFSRVTNGLSGSP